MGDGFGGGSGGGEISSNYSVPAIKRYYHAPAGSLTMQKIPRSHATPMRPPCKGSIFRIVPFSLVRMLLYSTLSTPTDVHGLLRDLKLQIENLSVSVVETRASVVETRASVDEAATSIKVVAESVAIRDTLQPILNYGSSKITQNRDPRFRGAVLKVYGYPSLRRTKALRCLLLDHLVPKHSLIAAHLFKFQWAPVSNKLLGVDINDPRNGLPMFKPLEDAFDTLRLAILCK